MPKKKFDSTAEVKTELLLQQKQGIWLGVQKVEEIRGKGVKFDMLGCIDVIAWNAKKEWLGVNGCTETDALEHMVTAQNSKELKEQWLDLGYKFCLYIYPNKKDRDEGEEGHRTIFFEDFGKGE
jgi:hypothetical protein